MWFFFNDGFVSVVENIDNASELLVRARRPEILQVLLPGREITKDLLADYRYRTLATKVEFAELVALRTMNIDYSNFKNSISNPDLYELCCDCWILHQLYQGEVDL